MLTKRKDNFFKTKLLKNKLLNNNFWIFIHLNNYKSKKINKIRLFFRENNIELICSKNNLNKKLFLNTILEHTFEGFTLLVISNDLKKIFNHWNLLNSLGYILCFYSKNQLININYLNNNIKNLNKKNYYLNYFIKLIKLLNMHIFLININLQLKK